MLVTDTSSSLTRATTSTRSPRMTTSSAPWVSGCARADTGPHARTSRTPAQRKLCRAKRYFIVKKNRTKETPATHILGVAPPTPRHELWLDLRRLQRHVILLRIPPLVTDDLE